MIHGIKLSKNVEEAQRELDRLCDEWTKCSSGDEMYIRLLCVKVAKLVRV